MELKILVYGSIFIILSIVFYPVIDFLIKDTLQAASFALYSSNKGVFYGLSIEMIFILFIGFIISLGAVLTFGFSSTFFVYERTRRK